MDHTLRAREVFISSLFIHCIATDNGATMIHLEIEHTESWDSLSHLSMSPSPQK